MAGEWPGSAEDWLFQGAVWGCGALNLGRRFVELNLPQAKGYNPYRVEIKNMNELPWRRDILWIRFLVFLDIGSKVWDDLLFGAGCGRVLAKEDVFLLPPAGFREFTRSPFGNTVPSHGTPKIRQVLSSFQKSFLD